ncbi:unnamed protein product [Absidia cylindrospora]
MKTCGKENQIWISFLNQQQRTSFEYLHDTKLSYIRELITHHELTLRTKLCEVFYIVVSVQAIIWSSSMALYYGELQWMLLGEHHALYKVYSCY